MNNHTRSSQKRQPFSRLYDLIPEDWEPDQAYRLNLDLARHNLRAGCVEIEHRFMDLIRDTFGDYAMAVPNLMGAAFVVAADSDETGLVLNPEVRLAAIPKTGMKRARLMIRLLELMGAIARTDAR